MTDPAWIATALAAARPQAMAALLRKFRDLDTAEDAFQEACLRALKHWPNQGPPRDTVGWLVFVGRNSAVDAIRRKSRDVAFDYEQHDVVDLTSENAVGADSLDAQDYRDDLLRLMFICANVALPANQQIALALRVVSGLSVAQIARAFLVSEDAMEQRVTRAKRRVAQAAVAFEAPGAAERAERVGAVAAMIYLIFNAGYTVTAEARETRDVLCDEAIRLARLLVRLFPAEAELLGLTALLLLQNARRDARFDADGQPVLLDEQDRSRWHAASTAEGLALLDKALRHRAPGAYQVQAAIAALHARAASTADTDWAQIEALYTTLEHLQPSPVVTLNRAVAVGELRGPAAALEIVDPLAKHLGGYFYYHGARGRWLARLGRIREAREASERAIALAQSAQEAALIRRALDREGVSL